MKRSVMCLFSLMGCALLEPGPTGGVYTMSNGERYIVDVYGAVPLTIYNEDRSFCLRFSKSKFLQGRDGLNRKPIPKGYVVYRGQSCKNRNSQERDWGVVFSEKSPDIIRLQPPAVISGAEGGEMVLHRVQ